MIDMTARVTRSTRHPRSARRVRLTVGAVLGVVVVAASGVCASSSALPITTRPATAGANAAGARSDRGADSGLAPMTFGPPLSAAGPPVPQGAGVAVPRHVSLLDAQLPGNSVNAEGIPDRVLAAYQRAVTVLDVSQPGCHLPLALLAAIGQVESGQAEGGRVDANGTALQPILGPVLDGMNGTAAMPDTDRGVLDGNSTWDRAVGPMQFIPSTWRRWAADGNGDGVADPQNIYDASLAAGRYLCADQRDLSTLGGLDTAILSYNHSASYLALVLMWMTVYSGQVVAVAVPTVAVAAAAPVPAGPATGSASTGTSAVADAPAPATVSPSTATPPADAAATTTAPQPPSATPVPAITIPRLPISPMPVVAAPGQAGIPCDTAEALDHVALLLQQLLPDQTGRQQRLLATLRDQTAATGCRPANTPTASADIDQATTDPLWTTCLAQYGTRSVTNLAAEQALTGCLRSNLTRLGPPPLP